MNFIFKNDINFKKVLNYLFKIGLNIEILFLDRFIDFFADKFNDFIYWIIIDYLLIK